MGSGTAGSMIQTTALVVICAFALWVAAGSFVAVVRPERARGWIARFAVSHLVNLAEQVWRGLAGAALIVLAPKTLAPELLRIAGLILLASAAALLVIPLRWHSGFARFWSRNLPLPAVRVAGLVGLAAACGMAIAAAG